MMDAAKKRKFKAIIVYRLDRISRNISDFASLIEELARLDISFVSIIFMHHLRQIIMGQWWQEL